MTSDDWAKERALSLLHDLQFYNTMVGATVDEADVLSAVTALREAEQRERESRPDDLRAIGWTVAVHNDYRLDGRAMTFWLLTKGDRAIKGEGETDADALNQCRALADVLEQEGGADER